MTTPSQLDRIEALLTDIRELLAWQPGVPQHLWTEKRAKARADMQRFAMEHPEILTCNEPGAVTRLYNAYNEEQKL